MGTRTPRPEAGHAQRYFIAGTDTGVGKTRITVGMLAAARSQGLRVAGMKPVATGAFLHDGHLINEDAVRISEYSPRSTPYQNINPYCLLEPISPHIAADRANIGIDIGMISSIALQLAAGQDLFLIEGTGGWHCPISAQESMADVARALAAPVILVVGLKLGCLNHARLTREAIARSPCRFAGWIGSQVEAELAALPENLSTLERLMGVPALALLPHAPDPSGDPARLGGAVQQLLRGEHWR